MKDFLDRLNEVRGNLSVNAFATALGMQQRTLDNYVKGERKPSVELIERICTNFNCSADWLLGLSPTRAPTAGGGPSVNAGSGAAVNIGSGSATAGGDCSKCRLMQDHIRQITGRA